MGLVLALEGSNAILWDNHSLGENDCTFYVANTHNGFSERLNSRKLYVRRTSK